MSMTTSTINSLLPGEGLIPNAVGTGKIASMYRHGIGQADQEDRDQRQHRPSSRGRHLPVGDCLIDHVAKEDIDGPTCPREGASDFVVPPFVDAERSEELCQRRIFRIHPVGFVEDGAQSFDQRTATSARSAEPRLDADLRSQEDRHVKIRFRREVVVQGRRRDSRFRGDIAVGRVLVSEHGEFPPTPNPPQEELLITALTISLEYSNVEIVCSTSSGFFSISGIKFQSLS